MLASLLRGLIPTRNIGRSRFIAVSTTIAANGSAQSWAHGLGTTPTEVVIVPVEGDNGAGAAGTNFPTITPGTHTSTNVVVTVTNGASYQIIAYK